MLLETILSALVPVGAEGLKQVITYFTGDVRPTTVEEKIKLESADVERLKALASLDQPVGTPSQWVVDLRASARYVGALFVIALGVGTLYIPVEDAVRSVALEGANVAFGFLFGTRIVASWQRK